MSFKTLSYEHKTVTEAKNINMRECTEFLIG